MKICSKCHQLKDESEVYFRKDNQKLRANCKECNHIWNRKWVQSNPVKIKARGKRWYQGNTEKVLSKNKKWAQDNPEKESARHKRWYQANFEKIAMRRKNYYQTNFEKLSAASKRWVKNNLERVRYNQRKWAQSNQERIEIVRTRWLQSNSEKVRSYQRKHKALMQGASISDFTDYDWRDLLFLYDHRCAYCRTDKKELTQDHVIPLSRGGDHTITNIVPACQSCNSRKGTKTLEEWRLKGNSNEENYIRFD